jgi:protein-disulfide isomerase
MRKSLLLACMIIVLLGSLTACNDDKNDDRSAVHAILFYSPSCPHCHQVMDEDLPPLSRKYGRQLVVLEVDTSTEQGQALFHAALAHYQIDSSGVPLMAVGDVVLRGSVEIPEQLPVVIEAGLASGGIDWPAIPGFVPPGD